MRARRQVLQDDAEDQEPSRQMRSTRQNVSRSNGIINDDSDDDSDDDQLLSQIMASQNRSKRSPRGSATHAPQSTEFVAVTSPVQQSRHFLVQTREKIANKRKQMSNSTNSTPTTNTSSSSSSTSTLNATHATSNSNHQTRSMTTSETTSQIERRRNQVK